MSGKLTDEHHDWTTKFVGLDTRAKAPGEPAPGSAPAPKGKAKDGFLSGVGHFLGHAAHAVGDAASSAAHAIGHAAVAAEHAVEGAAHAVGHAAVAAEHAVEGAAHAVGHAVGGVVGEVEDLFDAGPKAAAVKATAAKVKTISDADLDKMKPADKVKLVKELLQNGKPTAEAREAQRRLYRHMPLDSGFMKRDEQRGQQIADDLKGDKELEGARDNWSKLTQEQRLAALKKVVAARSKRMGIPPPEIKPFDDPKSKIDGYFDPSDGKLHFNMTNEDIKNFRETVDTAIHENAHNYQHHLVKLLHDGKIKPGDPDYDQATMFELNDMKNGYVPPEEDDATYRKQPMEEHSWATAPDTTSKILKTL